MSAFYAEIFVLRNRVTGTFHPLVCQFGREVDPKSSHRRPDIGSPPVAIARDGRGQRRARFHVKFSLSTRWRLRIEPLAVIDAGAPGPQPT